MNGQRTVWIDESQSPRLCLLNSAPSSFSPLFPISLLRPRSCVRASVHPCIPCVLSVSSITSVSTSLLKFDSWIQREVCASLHLPPPTSASTASLLRPPTRPEPIGPVCHTPFGPVLSHSVPSRPVGPSHPCIPPAVRHAWPARTLTLLCVQHCMCASGVRGNLSTHMLAFWFACVHLGVCACVHA